VLIIAVASYIAEFFASTIPNEHIQHGIQDLNRLLLTLIHDFPHVPAVSSNCYLAVSRPTPVDSQSAIQIEEHIWKNQSTELVIKDLVQAMKKVHGTPFLQRILENPSSPPAAIVLGACLYASETSNVPNEQRNAIVSALSLLRESPLSKSLQAAIHYTLGLLNHFPLYQYVTNIIQNDIFTFSYLMDWS
jgi:hypothetical protein